MQNKDAQKLLAFEKEQIKKLKQIVEQSIADENLIYENIENTPVEILTKGQKTSDKVARFGGSGAFILSFFSILFI